ncbi:MAG: hypothetical protein K0Q79_3667 [Flavipsychrobacter sp.]|jgi:hypothetical protein|nr:hypothetical protein [Flavipsychrobacter sp.]
MRNISLLLIVLFASLSLQAQKFEWAKTAGITGTYGIAQAYAVTVDGMGNVYSTGYYQYTIDFDPGIGIDTLEAVTQSLFIQKLDKNGNFLWAKRFAGVPGNTAHGRAIVADSSGNIYVTGQFSGTVDFDQGAGTYNLTSSGLQQDIFIAKLDASGNFVWAKAIGGTSGDGGQSIILDNSGNVLIVGNFAGTVDFDPGAGIFNLSSSSEGFLLKLASSGNFIWAKATASGGKSNAYGLSSDNSGNIFICGSFTNTCDFDPGPGTHNISTFAVNNENTYVSKLDPSGNFLWAKQIGGMVRCGAWSVKADAAGNAFITGYFNYTIDLDSGPGVLSVTSASPDYNTFVEKLDPAGNMLWAHHLSTTGNIIGMSIYTDRIGNVYSTGFFIGTVDFDPGPGTFFLSAGTAQYNYIQKLDGNGNILWAGNITSTNSVSTGAITVDNKANIYITGTFDGTSDFDRGTGTHNITSSGGWGDLFVEKMNQTVFENDTATVCGSYASSDTTYTASGYYLDTITAINGNDSIVALLLTVDTIPSAGTITGIDSVCTGSTITLSSTVTGGIWSAANATATVSSSGIITGVTPGVDTVMYIATNGTCADTAFYTVNVTVCSYAGIPGEPVSGIRLLAHPNPANNVINIAYRSANSITAHIIITDMLGKKVTEFEILPDTETKVPVNFPSGTYFINAIAGNTRFAEKITIVK